ncbi:MAG TPA: tRNA (adenosine(37)-N6)-threonylcarbamoyltransferase complex dimerization subunit type 1 TsaB [Gemmatimonadales bacterium]|jgi:tRNA threonylcarbamoyladenosine biosynthesis protein TsaB
MTLTVALDTATDVASLAVADDDRVLVEVSLPGRRHAAALLPGLTGALQMLGASLRDVGRVLCADGPGSFTGIRIGLATAQGIVRANEAVTVGTLPSLLATAWTAAPLAEGAVAAVYDALRGDVYGAVYRVSAGRVEVVAPPSLASFADLQARVPEPPHLVVGDLAVLDRSAVVAWTGRPPLPGGPRAAALIALDGVPGGIVEVPDVAAFAPDYGRPAEAQVRWERVHGRSLPDTRGEFR